MYYTYILESLQVPGKYHTGYSADFKTRLAHHNRGKCQHNAKLAPWKIHCDIAFETKGSARSFERYLKSGSGRAFAKRHFKHKHRYQEQT